MEASDEQACCHYRCGAVRPYRRLELIRRGYEVTILETYEEEVDVEDAENDAETGGSDAADGTAEGASGGSTLTDIELSENMEPDDSEDAGQNGGKHTVTKTRERTEAISIDLTKATNEQKTRYAKEFEDIYRLVMNFDLNRFKTDHPEFNYDNYMKKSAVGSSLLITV